MSAIVYGDANVFIMALESRPDVENPAAALLTAAADERLTLVTSAVTLAETLVMPLRFNEPETVETYRLILSGGYGGVSVRPVSPEVLEQAASLRAKHHGLGLPDALHLATALVARVRLFVSNDRALPRPTGLRFATPFEPAFTDLMAALP
ncbi:MAG: PIN domain-containing protein [Alphaproteobacteria bacterium]